MKYLKIKDNKGFYQIEPEKWKEIDKINKEDLMILLDRAIEGDFVLDEFEPDKLSNKAHLIIYKNLHEKLTELLENKDRFKDESEQLYKSAITKYSNIGDVEEKR